MADSEIMVRGRSASQALAASLTSSILASLRDYIILMNGSGHSIYTNQDITPLLRMKTSSLSGHVEPSQAEEVNLLQELDCPELQADIREALKAGAAPSSSGASAPLAMAHHSILCSDLHPDGLAIEYELTLPSVDQVRAASFTSNPPTHPHSPHRIPPQELLQEYTEDSFAVLLVIRIPRGSVHDYLSGVVDAVGGLLLHLPPGRSSSSSSSSGAGKTEGTSGGEDAAPVADQVELLTHTPNPPSGPLVLWASPSPAPPPGSLPHPHLPLDLSLTHTSHTSPWASPSPTRWTSSGAPSTSCWSP